jgi:hypothetical protein
MEEEADRERLAAAEKRDAGSARRMRTRKKRAVSVGNK